ncbi:carboxymuconolactone decarboxylase family protein [Siccirubricoccus sp. G192]|uniref:carboxymuconolactone decarboxylase family protein n=1 Tax=Siccirubricoccus sp. G192 TaxID=2849651 RepID=UPI001C2B88A4|nr:carboxymuconolactone decarboxylase family protein [Siccirubricoccus sp. G192]MBV1796602.1 carboxymuconolactone decarboxylase family protein [Siccirubricoccus sp. G192]
MEQRLDANAAAPAAMKAVLGVEAYIRGCGLEPALIELVKMRASQINGCAFCLDMHSHDARQRGETEQRLYVLDAWREVPFYSPRERAALAWTEALTRIAETHAPDEDYAELRRNFSEREMVDLTTLIGLINLWNRLAIGFRNQPPVRKATAA